MQSDRVLSGLAWLGALALSVGFFLIHSGLTFLSSEPATGGDTGSHFYTLWLLKHEGFQVWSPAHLMGEMSLVHYFPGSFLVMLALSWWMPLGMAFNLGTVLPMMLFPLSVFYALRGLGSRFSQAFLSLLGATLFLYNESFTIWGGNALSVLAGQFAHMYALVFLFLFIGTLGFEFRAKRFPILSALLLGLIPIFHMYVYLFAPFVLLGFWLREGMTAAAFKRLFAVGALSLLNSLWFVWPLLDNSEWTTKIDMRWEFGQLFYEALPLAVLPLVLLGLLLVPLLTYMAGRQVLVLGELVRGSSFWLIPALGAVGLYLVFPLFGLTNVRALPQGLIFLTLWSAEMVARSLGLLDRTWRWLVLSGLMLSGLWWGHWQMEKYPHWFEWNYSGWEAKAKFPQIQALAEELKGDFSKGRVVNEHHPDLNQAGTTRVFEMLPYWSGRATVESLYAESTHTAYLAHDIQARISDRPSCFLHFRPCPRLELEGIESRLRLLGIQDILVLTEEARRGLVDQAPTLLYRKMNGFHVFSFPKPVALAEVVYAPIKLVPRSNWQERFIEWYDEYAEDENERENESERESPFLLALSKGQSLLAQEDLNGVASSEKREQCATKVQVRVNQIDLSTDCPGAWHLLKFSYHPYWRTRTGEEIYLLSPGFMALRPEGQDVTLYIDTPSSWWMARGLSLLGSIVLSLHLFLSIIRRESRRSQIEGDL